MDEQQITGDAHDAAGKAETTIGVILDDPELEAEGDLNRIEGKVQSLIGDLQDGVCDAADRVTAAAIRAGEQARTLYADITVRAQDAGRQIDPFVREKPYASVGLAVLGGLFLGMLYANRGPKVVVLKTHH